MWHMTFGGLYGAADTLQQPCWHHARSIVEISTIQEIPYAIIGLVALRRSWAYLCEVGHLIGSLRHPQLKRWHLWSDFRIFFTRLPSYIFYPCTHRYLHYTVASALLLKLHSFYISATTSINFLKCCLFR